MKKGKWFILLLVVLLVLVAAVPIASAAPKSDLPGTGDTTTDDPATGKHKRCPPKGCDGQTLLE
jgi:hypothetical protein